MFYVKTKMNVSADYKYIYLINDKDVITFVGQDWIQWLIAAPDPRRSALQTTSHR